VPNCISRADYYPPGGLKSRRSRIQVDLAYQRPDFGFFVVSFEKPLAPFRSFDARAYYTRNFTVNYRGAGGSCRATSRRGNVSDQQVLEQLCR